MKQAIKLLAELRGVTVEELMGAAK